MDMRAHGSHTLRLLPTAALCKVVRSMHSMRDILAAPALLSSAPLAFGSAEIVDNFRLTDQQGTSHELYYLSDMKAVVLLAQGTGCDASQKAAATLERLRAKYEPQGVTFLLLDSNLQDAASREALARKETRSEGRRVG